LAIEIGDIVGAGLRVWLCGRDGHFFDDFRGRSRDGCPQFDIRIRVVGNGLAVICLCVVGLVEGTGLAHFCKRGEVLVLRA